MVSKILFVINSFNFFDILFNYSDPIISFISFDEPWEVFKEKLCYRLECFLITYMCIHLTLILKGRTLLDLLGLKWSYHYYFKVYIVLVALLTVFYVITGLIIFIKSYSDPEVYNQLSPVVCHLSSSFPPVTYPNPYQGCYVNFNSFEGISLISSLKLKSYPYMVFGGVEPYTTSLTVKVPFFVSDSKLFILLEKIL